MRVLTDIGEVGLHLDGDSIVLRPSLYAMTKLGGPAELVARFALIHSPPPYYEISPRLRRGLNEATIRENERLFRNHARQVFWSCWEVLAACADGQDISRFAGTPGDKYGSYRVGAMPTGDIIHIARALMQHGIIGRSLKEIDGDEDSPKPDGETFAKEFHAAQYVALAMAHLGMPEDAAWNMTMTSFVKAMRAKFGEQKEDRSAVEHKKTMTWLQQVNAIRDKGKA